jgi:hypothetical protein
MSNFTDLQVDEILRRVLLSVEHFQAIQVMRRSRMVRKGQDVMLMIEKWLNDDCRKDIMEISTDKTMGIDCYVN